MFGYEYFIKFWIKRTVETKNYSLVFCHLSNRSGNSLFTKFRKLISSSRLSLNSTVSFVRMVSTSSSKVWNAVIPSTLLVKASFQLEIFRRKYLFLSPKYVVYSICPVFSNKFSALLVALLLIFSVSVISSNESSGLSETYISPRIRAAAGCTPAISWEMPIFSIITFCFSDNVTVIYFCSR